MKPNLGITEEHRLAVVQLLNKLLADEFVLYVKTRNYHWNVVGPQFHDLHKFFEAQYEELDDIVDEVAERARSLGGEATGTLNAYLKNTRLQDQAVSGTASAMVADLLKAHEELIRHLRVDLETCGNTYRDMGTSDFLTGLMEQHEKMAWMLRATLA